MNETNETSRSRRRFLAGGAAVAGTLLAGCSSSEDASNEDGSGNGDGSSYAVSMAPVGEVTFSETPASAAIYEPGYADMVVGLGLSDAVESVGVPSRYHTRYYDELDGVSMDKDSLTPLWNDGIDKEVFYEIDADVHLIDPNWLIENGAFGLDEEDVQEVRENVAPFIGNTIFRQTDEWHDYEYYSMYEAFEKVAEVFQRTDRYEAFASFHDDVLGRVQDDLPEDRPEAARVYGAGNEPEEFSPQLISNGGTFMKPFQDLGIEDAFEGTSIDGISTDERGTIDYEALLEIDPDVLLVSGTGHEQQTAEEFRNTVVSFMESHDTASELTAVQNGRVFRGGPVYQGPIQNLFLTERYAHAFFPDVFESEELFDRDELATIINGDA